MPAMSLFIFQGAVASVGPGDIKGDGTLSRNRLIGVDVGGTFTDVVAMEDGLITALKVPTDLNNSELSVLAGAKESAVDRARSFNLASTAGLNAVITRSIPKVAFVTTIGHRDILDRGRAWRPFDALTDISWRRGFSDAARPLVPRYLRRGIRERLTADGQVLVALDEEHARAELEVLRRCGVAGVAICFLHAYVNPQHELRMRELVYEVLGRGVACSISSQVSPLAGEYSRSSTTTVDLLMKLKYADYLQRLDFGLSELGFEGEFNCADCSAMLMPASYALERASSLVVGGPAAGTVASAYFGSVIGKSNLICADVGGTSCDISVVLDGQPWVNSTFEIEWDLVVNALSTEIVTLGAGGGSIVSVGPTGELRVGPESAGSEPGPACYGQGGDRPTVTDCAVSIGIIQPQQFLAGRMPLDLSAADTAFERLDSSLSLSQRIRHAWMIGLHNIAEGIIDITIRRGIDLREFDLIAFGAAGPMILPSLLDLVPLGAIVVPPHPGGFSALGLLSADQVFSESRTLYGVLNEEIAPQVSQLFDTMERELLIRARSTRAEAKVIRTFDGRLLGQGWDTPFISVPLGPLDENSLAQMTANFHAEYKRRNGNSFERLPVEGVTYRVQVVIASEKVRYSELAPRVRGAEVPWEAMVTLHHLYEADVEAACYHRSHLAAGDVIAGPAIVWETTSTTFVPLNRAATVGSYGELVVN
jgi:N-methylhydantoinase A